MAANRGAGGKLGGIGVGGVLVIGPVLPKLSPGDM